MSVLVVDDDPTNRGFLADALIDAGHTVVEARDGHEALTWLAQAPSIPSLILLDLVMPVKNGWEVCAALACDPLLGSIPVVILSGLGDIDVAIRKPPVVQVLYKPVVLERLLLLVARYDAILS